VLRVAPTAGERDLPGVVAQERGALDEEEVRPGRPGRRRGRRGEEQEDRRLAVVRLGAGVEAMDVGDVAQLAACRPGDEVRQVAAYRRRVHRDTIGRAHRSACATSQASSTATTR